MLAYGQRKYESGGKEMKAYMQRMGRSLMLPVAVLPAASLLVGIANWIVGTAGANSLTTF